MNSTKSLVGAAMAAALGLGAVNAQAAILDVTEMSITGGTFSLGFGDNQTPGDLAPIITGSYQGSPSGDAATSLTTFTFFGLPVGTHTADNLGGAMVAVNGGAPENPAPITATVDTDAGTISVDMGSWFAFWNGTTFNQGNHDVMGTFDVGTGAYDIAWTSLIVGGPFNNQTGSWSLQGVATVVPVPAAVWLFGSAVVGFAGLSRRRKLAA